MDIPYREIFLLPSERPIWSGPSSIWEQYRLGVKGPWHPRIIYPIPIIVDFYEERNPKPRLGLLGSAPGRMEGGPFELDDPTGPTDGASDSDSDPDDHDDDDHHDRLDSPKDDDSDDDDDYDYRNDQERNKLAFSAALVLTYGCPPDDGTGWNTPHRRGEHPSAGHTPGGALRSPQNGGGGGRQNGYGGTHQNGSGSGHQHGHSQHQAGAPDGIVRRIRATQQVPRPEASRRATADCPVPGAPYGYDHHNNRVYRLRRALSAPLHGVLDDFFQGNRPADANSPLTGIPKPLRSDAVGQRLKRLDPDADLRGRYQEDATVKKDRVGLLKNPEKAVAQIPSPEDAPRPPTRNPKGKGTMKAPPETSPVPAEKTTQGPGQIPSYDEPPSSFVLPPWFDPKWKGKMTADPETFPAPGTSTIQGTGPFPSYLDPSGLYLPRVSGPKGKGRMKSRRSLDSMRSTITSTEPFPDYIDPFLPQSFDPKGKGKMEELSQNTLYQYHRNTPYNLPRSRPRQNTFSTTISSLIRVPSNYTIPPGEERFPSYGGPITSSTTPAGTKIGDPTSSMSPPKDDTTQPAPPVKTGVKPASPPKDDTVQPAPPSKTEVKPASPPKDDTTQPAPPGRTEVKPASTPKKNDVSPWVNDIADDDETAVASSTSITKKSLRKRGWKRVRTVFRHKEKTPDASAGPKAPNAAAGSRPGSHGGVKGVWRRFRAQRREKKNGLLRITTPEEKQRNQQNQQNHHTQNGKQPANRTAPPQPPEAHVHRSPPQPYTTKRAGSPYPTELLGGPSNQHQHHDHHHRTPHQLAHEFFDPEAGQKKAQRAFDTVALAGAGNTAFMAAS